MLRLTPKAGRNTVDGWVHDPKGTPLSKARVAAPPEDGKANAALVTLLAEFFAVRKSAVTIASGASARLKRITIDGDRNALLAQLKQFGDAA